MSPTTWRRSSAGTEGRAVENVHAIQGARIIEAARAIEGRGVGHLDRRGVPGGLDRDLADAARGKADALRRAARQVDDAPAVVGLSVGDGDHHRVAGVAHRDQHPRAQRQAGMGGGHLGGVKHRAAAGAMSRVAPAVPGGLPALPPSAAVARRRLPRHQQRRGEQAGAHPDPEPGLESRAKPKRRCAHG